MQTAGSGPDSPATAIFATLPATASGHPGNLGYNTERHLLYVACTRARDHLLVTGSTGKSFKPPVGGPTGCLGR